LTRADYPHVMLIQTRWNDNDMYQHTNNVIYYECFDTIINAFLIQHGHSPSSAANIGLVAESGCQFLASFSYPEVIEARLRVGKLGNSSVRYELALFKSGRDEPAATGFVVHVFVRRETQQSTPIPEPLRAALTCLISSP
jgi:acyl-CoA thioester hydrolase